MCVENKTDTLHDWKSESSERHNWLFKAEIATITQSIKYRQTPELSRENEFPLVLYLN